MAKRQRIKGKGILEHPQPFPAAIRIGNMVFTSNVFGDDPETHEVPKDLDTQCKNVFDAMRRIMEGAGGSVGDIAKTELAISAIPSHGGFCANSGPAALNIRRRSSAVSRRMVSFRPSPSMTVSVAAAAAIMDAEGVIRCDACGQQRIQAFAGHCCRPSRLRRC